MIKYIYGLVGKNINYSFSKNYFLEKFSKSQLNNFTYKNFDIGCIDLVRPILKNKNICGLNVTIPYKKKIIPYLDKISNKANKIGAVNTVFFDKKGKSIGYNTDAHGFQKALTEKLNEIPKYALILGTGGASQAVSYSLQKMGIQFKVVSRNTDKNFINYNDINKDIIETYRLIINTTPLGTYPKINDVPPIPYHLINKSNILYDLIYNPKETLFLKNGKDKGCITINGYKMLVYQAEKSWQIWNK